MEVLLKSQPVPAHTEMQLSLTGNTPECQNVPVGFMWALSFDGHTVEDWVAVWGVWGVVFTCSGRPAGDSSSMRTGTRPSARVGELFNPNTS